MKILSVSTPVGTFTRKTAAPYVAVVVWNSPRARRDIAYIRAHGLSLSGVDARWAKDNEYGTTWHTSWAAAEKAARSGYKWDAAASLVGIFNLSGE